MAKETCIYGKRDLYIWQKRPIHMAKETYSIWREVLILKFISIILKLLSILKVRLKFSYLVREFCCTYIWQKRPVYMAKETHSYGKRDLFNLTWSLKFSYLVREFCCTYICVYLFTFRMSETATQWDVFVSRKMKKSMCLRILSGDEFGFRA